MINLQKEAESRLSSDVKKKDRKKHSEGDEPDGIQNNE